MRNGIYAWIIQGMARCEFVGGSAKYCSLSKKSSQCHAFYGVTSSTRWEAFEGDKIILPVQLHSGRDCTRRNEVEVSGGFSGTSSPYDRNTQFCSSCNCSVVSLPDFPAQMASGNGVHCVSTDALICNHMANKEYSIHATFVVAMGK